MVCAVACSRLLAWHFKTRQDGLNTTFTASLLLFLEWSELDLFTAESPVVSKIALKRRDRL